MDWPCCAVECTLQCQGDAVGNVNGKGTESRGGGEVCLIQSLGIALLSRLRHSTKKAALPQGHEVALS